MLNINISVGPNVVNVLITPKDTSTVYDSDIIIDSIEIF